MNSRTFAVIVAGVILVFVIDLVRRHKMTFKFSMSWLAICLIVLFASLNAPLLQRLSTLAGFSLPSNFIFFIIIVFFIFLSLFLTIYISEENSRSETLAQDLGILEYQLKRLEQTVAQKEKMGRNSQK